MHEPEAATPERGAGPAPSAALDPGRLVAEAGALVDFARGARHPVGFGWLDESGRLTERPVELWISCRMTHVFALAALQGDEASLPVAQHGIEALRGPLRDAEHGGWFAAVGERGVTDDAKQAYGHAFVVLAAASGHAADVAGAGALLDEALDVLDRRFWEEPVGMARESFDRSWSESERYRGVNANMHLVEALLAAHNVTGDPRLLDRAGRVTRRVLGLARDHDHRLPEHFSEDWHPRLDHHRDQPAHPFRPFGVTIGHLLEWARLSLQVRHAESRAAGADPGLPSDAVAPSDAGLVSDAVALYERAVGDGWVGGEEPGFCYTTDFEGRPVVTQRMHWVVAEAVAASWVLHQVTGAPAYARQCEEWLDLARRRFVDPERGSWWHELDEANRPAATVWSGKPDIYHAYQALLTPTLPLASSYVGALLPPP